MANEPFTPLARLTPVRTMNDREPNDTNLDAPDKLRAALVRSQARRLIVPPATDAAILRAARERLETVRESRREHVARRGAEFPLSQRVRAGGEGLGGGAQHCEALTLTLSLRERGEAACPRRSLVSALGHREQSP